MMHQVSVKCQLTLPNVTSDVTDIQMPEQCGCTRGARGGRGGGLLPLGHLIALENDKLKHIKNQLLEQINLDKKKKKGADTDGSLFWDAGPMMGNHFHRLLGQMGQITGGSEGHSPRNGLILPTSRHQLLRGRSCCVSWRRSRTPGEAPTSRPNPPGSGSALQTDRPRVRRRCSWWPARQVKGPRSHVGTVGPSVPVPSVQLRPSCVSSSWTMIGPPQPPQPVLFPPPLN